MAKAEAAKAPKQGSDEWRELRKRGIGGSDIAILAGLTPWGSPYGVYMDKKGLAPPVVATDAMKRGNILEEPIARWWSAEMGMAVEVEDRILHHAEHDWARASIDRRTPDGILEIKTTHEDWSYPPEYVLAQVQWYLGIVPAAICHVAALTGGLNFRKWVVRADPGYFGDLLDIGWAFIRDHLDPGIPPEIDGSRGTTEVIDRMYPATLEKVMIPATPEVLRLAGKLHLAKLWEAVGDIATNRLKVLIGDAGGVAGPGFRFTLTNTKGRSWTDWPAVVGALEADYPGAKSAAEKLAPTFTKQYADSRRMTPTWLDDGPAPATWRPPEIDAG